ncbi:MAG: hypothetical protein ACI9FU_000329 [Granulosicoccus sp.]
MDGNTVLDRCGNAVNVGANENFNVQFIGPSLTSAVATSSDCGQTNGEAGVSVNGGTGPLSYEWNTSPSQYGANATNLPSGFWVCTVMDANSCIDELMIPVLGVGSPTVPTLSTTPVTCNGLSDGSAEIEVVGNGPFDVLWGGYPALSGEMVSGLSGGSVVLTIIDA